MKIMHKIVRKKKFFSEETLIKKDLNELLVKEFLERGRGNNSKEK